MTNTSAFVDLGYSTQVECSLDSLDVWPNSIVDRRTRSHNRLGGALAL